MVQERRRLTAEDWAQAALSAFGEGGLSAVAVESIAAGLGTTKGSFYWHFANREALVAAALELWERRSTDDRIFALEAEPDPVSRLRLLFTEVSGTVGRDGTENRIRAAADHPAVAATLRRVVQRRLAYVIDLFEQIGFPRQEAVRRGTLAYVAYTGHSELTHAVPGALPFQEGGGLGRYVDWILDALLHT